MLFTNRKTYFCCNICCMKRQFNGNTYRVLEMDYYDYYGVDNNSLIRKWFTNLRTDMFSFQKLLSKVLNC